MNTPAKFRQHIHYVTSFDGTRLAWAESGAGPVLVKAANWLTHLEYEWESPVWKHWMQFFTAHVRFVRHDERGCGMSEWNGRQLVVETWTADLEAIIVALNVAARLEAQMPLAAESASLYRAIVPDGARLGERLFETGELRRMSETGLKADEAIDRLSARLGR